MEEVTKSSDSRIKISENVIAIVRNEKTGETKIITNDKTGEQKKILGKQD